MQIRNETTLRINAKGISPHESELFKGFKNMYSMYWDVENNGEPRSGTIEGEFWNISFRISRYEDGSPQIEKEVYYKKGGNLIKIADDSKHEIEGTMALEEGLARTRKIVETMAFLTSAHEAHKPLTGDIVRISDTAAELDSFHLSPEGRRLQSQLESDYVRVGRENVGVDAEIVTWNVVDPEVHNLKKIQDELQHARSIGERLPLPPHDSGAPRFDQRSTGLGAEGSLAGKITWG